MMDNTERMVWVISLVLVFVLGVFQGSLITFQEGLQDGGVQDDFVFKCNPHYFGPEYTYPNTCSNSYINATGNYCNGVLVCENKLREERG